MKAMILNKISELGKNRAPLQIVDIPVPEPDKNEIRIKVSVCGVCHTELDEIEGRLMPSNLPMVLGHQVVGLVEKFGPRVSKFKLGDRVGVAWIFSACGKCKFCLNGTENLCTDFLATGKDVTGFLQLAVAAEIRPEVRIFSLQEANIALLELKERHIRGAKVLRIS